MVKTANEQIERKPIGLEEQGIINTCAELCTFMYTDIQKEEYNGKTLSEIIRELAINMETAIDEGVDFKKVLTITRMIEDNPVLGEIMLLDQSSISHAKLDGDRSQYNGFDGDLIRAAAFLTPGNQVVVAYRGTGDGKWLDNGYGLAASSTVMQEAAARYFDYVVENVIGRDRTLASTDPEIYITGHSKGGNEAQFAQMLAQRNESITKCYSFDGQGFSPEAIDTMKACVGTTGFELYRNQIMSICGHNDFVNTLGISIAPAENTYYVKTTNRRHDLGGNHDIEYMFLRNNLGGGTSRLNFTTNENHEAISAERGSCSLFSEELSKNAMRCNAKERESFALSIMDMIERHVGHKREGTGDVKHATLDQHIRGIGKTLDLLTEAIFMHYQKHNQLDRKANELAARARDEHDFGCMLGSFFYRFGALGYKFTFASLAVATAVIPSITSKLADFAKVCFPHKTKVINGLEEEMKRFLIAEKQLRIKDMYKGRIRGDIDFKDCQRDHRSYKEAKRITGSPELKTLIYPNDISAEAFIKSTHDKYSVKESCYSVVRFTDIFQKTYNPDLTHEENEYIAIAKTAMAAAEEIKKGADTLLLIPGMEDVEIRERVNAILREKLSKIDHFTSVSVMPLDAREDSGTSRIYKYCMEHCPPDIYEYDFVLNESPQLLQGLDERQKDNLIEEQEQDDIELVD